MDLPRLMDLSLSDGPPSCLMDLPPVRRTSHLPDGPFICLHRREMDLPVGWTLYRECKGRWMNSRCSQPRSGYGEKCLVAKRWAWMAVWPPRALQICENTTYLINVRILVLVGIRPAELAERCHDFGQKVICGSPIHNQASLWQTHYIMAISL